MDLIFLLLQGLGNGRFWIREMSSAVFNRWGAGANLGGFFKFVLFGPFYITQVQGTTRVTCFKSGQPARELQEPNCN